jgi:hypothetical protein
MFPYAAARQISSSPCASSTTSFVATAAGAEFTSAFDDVVARASRRSSIAVSSRAARCAEVTTSVVDDIVTRTHARTYTTTTRPSPFERTTRDECARKMPA